MCKSKMYNYFNTFFNCKNLSSSQQGREYIVFPLYILLPQFAQIHYFFFRKLTDSSKTNLDTVDRYTNDDKK